MKKIILILLFTTLIFSGFFDLARADMGGEESIEMFDSRIVVNLDNSIDVEEIITYNTGPMERHGIYRDIYPYSSLGYKMAIENVIVTGENEKPYMFTISSSDGNVRIKIGDPDKTFTGLKTYSIKYHATKAIAQFKDFDEIYWNVTGNEWNIPIYNASAVVILPDGTQAKQLACYYGPKSSTTKCEDTEKGTVNGGQIFHPVVSLNPKEGLTVAVGFPKGVVAAYTSADKVRNLFDLYLPWIIAIGLPLLTLVLSLLYWYKKGRDPKGTGVIVPQYDVPDNLTPMEVVGIAEERINNKDISAEIIYLATQGYLKISQIEERVLGLFNSTDYELTKLKNYPLLGNDFDQKLLSGLFGSSSAVRLSALKNVFYQEAALVIKSVLDALLTKGYYKNLGRMKNGAGRAVVLIFMSVWASGFFGGLIGAVVLGGNPFPVIAGIFFSIIIYGIVSHFNPAKTEKGVATKEYILGLKDYLRIAEKDRLLFHNAPEKKPEVFERLLPYAMVLGVANIWAKEFEGIYTTPPSWYSGSSDVNFNAVVFTHSMSNFSSYASSSLSSSPSGGGSGGGGSSGGGGGGGGGGGW